MSRIPNDKPPDRNQKPEAPQAPLSLLDLQGLGREIWEGIDAQAYVNELRAEWEDR